MSHSLSGKEQDCFEEVVREVWSERMHQYNLWQASCKIHVNLLAAKPVSRFTKKLYKRQKFSNHQYNFICKSSKERKLNPSAQHNALYKLRHSWNALH